ncbi:MAG: hypothetical protein WBY66_12850, partial [Candidatus Acidiferrales bacterium]
EGRPNMKEDVWIAISTEGRIVKYGYKELTDGVAGISAKMHGRFLMILQRSIRAPLTRKQVEANFEQFLRTDHRTNSSPWEPLM